MTRNPVAALIVEGGAMRGIFSTGVLDGFLAKGFDPFDYYLGVSAGSGNIAAYLARMPGRNLKIYTDYSLRPEFISWARALRGKPVMDLDWLWDITIKEIRLDLDTIYERGKPFQVCLTNLETGKAIYKPTDPDNLEEVLKASSALPLLYNQFPVIDGIRTLDGGISDPLPVMAAIRAGAKRIMIIRSRPGDYQKTSGFGYRLVRWRLAMYPALRTALSEHAMRYNRSITLIRNPPPGVDVIEICPPKNLGISRLERSRGKLKKCYELGIQTAEKAMELWDTHES